MPDLAFVHDYGCVNEASCPALAHAPMWQVPLAKRHGRGNLKLALQSSRGRAATQAEAQQTPPQAFVGLLS